MLFLLLVFFFRFYHCKCIVRIQWKLMLKVLRSFSFYASMCVCVVCVNEEKGVSHRLPCTSHRHSFSFFACAYALGHTYSLQVPHIRLVAERASWSGDCCCCCGGGCYTTLHTSHPIYVNRKSYFATANTRLHYNYCHYCLVCIHITRSNGLLDAGCWLLLLLYGKYNRMKCVCAVLVELATLYNFEHNMKY